MINEFPCIDTHCHLHYLEKNYLLSDVMQRAKNNNIQKLITIGIDWSDCDKLINYYHKFNNVFCAIGVHPHNAKHWYQRIQDIDFDSFIHHKQVVALGETGLDFSLGREDQEAQFLLFNLHLEACKKYNLPVVIHCRSATDDVLRILRQHHYQPGETRGVIHCFQESLTVAREFIDLGFYLSLSGMVTFKTQKWKDFHQVVAKLPADRILVETDAPYLTPEPHRSHINEPAYIPLIINRIALLQNCSALHLAAQIYKNTHNVFTRLNL